MRTTWGLLLQQSLLCLVTTWWLLLWWCTFRGSSVRLTVCAFIYYMFLMLWVLNKMKWNEMKMTPQATKKNKQTNKQKQHKIWIKCQNYMLKIKNRLKFWHKKIVKKWINQRKSYTSYFSLQEHTNAINNEQYWSGKTISMFLKRGLLCLYQWEILKLPLCHPSSIYNCPSKYTSNKTILLFSKIL